MSIKTLQPLEVNLSGTKLIDASAGTGKTYTITILLLRLLLERELDLDQILVVTFTRAATTELRERVRLRLMQALALFEDESDGDDVLLQDYYEQRLRANKVEADQRRLRLALRQLDDAAILTIHGFCQRMLQENAFESGVDFDTELVSDLSPVLRDIVHKFWAQHIYSLPDALVRYLQQAKTISFDKLMNLAKRVASLSEMPILPDDLPRLDPQQSGLSDDDKAQILKGLEIDFVDFVRSELPKRQRELRQQSFDDLLVQLRDALRQDASGSLQQRIAERYPAALIDEFQDTDPVQYEIFHRLYHAHKAPLFLIGDPKQAIYSFRGADVFAYMKAIEDAGEETYTLSTNYRSDETLVQAVNTLFDRVHAPFLFSKIHFTPVAAAQKEQRLQFAEDAKPAPLQILFVERDDKLLGKRSSFMNGGNLTYVFPQLMAREISGFLRSGAQIDGQAVQAGDIAVLCRSNRQLTLMQNALREVGVPSVLQSQDGVFASDEAQDMLRIAWAMAEPERAHRLKAALTTRTFAVLSREFHLLQNDVAQWNDKVSQFHLWHETWQRKGFIQAFQRLLVDAHIETRLLAYTDGERSVTNLLHLAELMQAQAQTEHLAPVALCHWLESMCRGDEEEQDSAQLRLESDAAAVKLVTIHRSKGMEYPVVYCPYLWDAGGLKNDDKRWLKFHDRDDGLRLKLDLAADSKSPQRKWAEFENAAEDLRLLYVAMTRAKHRCSIVWGAKNRCEKSALAYLLHQLELDTKVQGVEFVESLLEKTRKHIKTLKTDALFLQDLQSLVQASQGCIAIKPVNFAQAQLELPAPTQQTQKMCARALQNSPRQGWRVGSFSALTATEQGKSVHFPGPGEADAEGPDHDAEAEFLLSEALSDDQVNTPGDDDKHLLLAQKEHADSGSPDDQEEEKNQVTLASGERGAAFGTYVHKVFELLDFSADEKEMAHLVFALATHMGRKKQSGKALVQALTQILQTPLSKVDKDFCLQKLARADRLDELEFHLAAGFDSLADGAEAAGLNPAELAEIFAQNATHADLRHYAASVKELGFRPLTGYLKGYIDLVFVHAGRWYIVDYKTNYLGDRVADYSADKLAVAMAEHHYYLQYHLYTLALHRYLRQRLRDYDYKRDFGGVLYLFVRGMHPDYPSENGVYFDRPEYKIINKLDKLLGASAQAARPAQGGQNA